MGDDDAEARQRLSRIPPRWMTIVSLAFSGLCAAFMYTLVIPLQSELPTLLDSTREEASWIVTSTLLAAAIATPISGRLGDLYGKRRVVIALIVLLMLGSIIAGLFDSISGVITGRALQGTVTGVIPLGIAIMRDVLPSERLGTSVALMSATMGIGSSMGMPLAAALAEHADWRTVFWFAAGLGAIALVLVLVLVFVPADVMRAEGSIDVPGVLGLTLGLAGVMLCISHGSDWGWGATSTLVSGIGGVVVLLIWAAYQLRVKHPLVDLRVAARRGIRLVNLVAIVSAFAHFSSNVVFPQLLELPAGAGGGFGLSMVQAAFVIMPAGVCMILISPISGWLERTLGPKLLLVIGTSAIVCAYVFVLLWSSNVWHILIGNIFIGIGIGFSFAGMPLIIMRSVEAHETGASNGLNALFRSVGTSSAAAVMGAVLATKSFNVDGEMVPMPEAFALSFWISLGAALIALLLSLLIPRHSTTGRHPSIPERISD